MKKFDWFEIIVSIPCLLICFALIHDADITALRDVRYILGGYLLAYGVKYISAFLADRIIRWFDLYSKGADQDEG